MLAIDSKLSELQTCSLKLASATSAAIEISCKLEPQWSKLNLDSDGWLHLALHLHFSVFNVSRFVFKVNS